MLSPDDTTQTNETIGHVPRTFDRRSAFSERRQNILQQKQNEKETESLPAMKMEAAEHSVPHAKITARQVNLLREENRRLHHELEAAHSATQRLLVEYSAIQSEFEREFSAIHSGQLQEIERYQEHLLAVTNERNRLYDAHKQLERRYQELYANFQTAVQEEYDKKMSEAAQTLLLTPDQIPVNMNNDFMKTIEFHVNQLKTKQLVEARYLTGEVQRITVHLEQEQSQVEVERQNLLRMQNSVHEQAELRYKTIQAHLRTRWTAALAFVTTGALVTLVVLQYVFLSIFHVHFAWAITISLVAPILICVVAFTIFSTPFSAIRHHYLSAPQKQKAKKHT